MVSIVGFSFVAGTKLVDDGSGIINSGSQLNARKLRFVQEVMFKRNIHFAYFRVSAGLA